jgi:hypothetical protein
VQAPVPPRLRALDRAQRLLAVAVPWEAPAQQGCPVRLGRLAWGAPPTAPRAPQGGSQVLLAQVQPVRAVYARPLLAVCWCASTGPPVPLGSPATPERTRSAVSRAVTAPPSRSGPPLAWHPPPAVAAVRPWPLATDAPLATLLPMASLVPQGGTRTWAWCGAGWGTGAWTVPRVALATPPGAPMPLARGPVWHRVGTCAWPVL